MEQVAIRGRIRTKLTKGERNRIRREGGVPAVLYGRNVESTPISIDADSFKTIAAQNGRGLVELDIEGIGRHHAIIHHIDRDPLNRQVLHIDFHAVSLDEPVDVEVPVYLNGLEAVEKRGGVIQQQMREVLVRALPVDVPEYLVEDISHMDIGNNLRVKDLQVPAKCEIKSDPEEVIVSVIAAKNAPPDTEIEPKEPDLVHDTEGEGVGAHEAPGAHD
ncbi:50S ribosomal protein L25 [Effusibacillus pohliae]|uniref:50S ribosomal protein L25 n=1 Tax=Effusibacillus pohliae TaxID=232270 RepID=UPI00036065B4|nr:50S ribosomal protein L25 [Effusibacillus pohliae]